MSSQHDDRVKRERDLLRDAILRHRDAQRPSCRRQHDHELYAALSEAARPGPDAQPHLRRQHAYFADPTPGY